MALGGPSLSRSSPSRGGRGLVGSVPGGMPLACSWRALSRTKRDCETASYRISSAAATLRRLPTRHSQRIWKPSWPVTGISAEGAWHLTAAKASVFTLACRDECEVEFTPPAAELTVATVRRDR